MADGSDGIEGGDLMAAFSTRLHHVPATALTGAAARYAWRRWEYVWQARGPGPVTLRSRAFDAAGRTQPTVPEWNPLGYANNAIQVMAVTVTC